MIGQNNKQKLWLLLSFADLTEEEKTDLLYCSICSALDDNEFEKLITEIRERTKK